MAEQYAILDQANGHLVNVVLWDGDTAKWQPSAGTSAVRLADIDLATLPPAPAPEADPITAAEWVERHLTPLQILSLQRLEMALLTAAKPLGNNMAALKAWLEGMMLASVDPTPRTFALPPCSYEAASAEAVTDLAG
jgi:hypothetical protein